MGQTQYTNRFAIDPKTAATFGTEELRENFLLPHRRRSREHGRSEMGAI